MARTLVERQGGIEHVREQMLKREEHEKKARQAWNQLRDQRVAERMKGRAS